MHSWGVTKLSYTLVTLIDPRSSSGASPLEALTGSRHNMKNERHQLKLGLIFGGCAYAAVLGWLLLRPHSPQLRPVPRASGHVIQIQLLSESVPMDLARAAPAVPPVSRQAPERPVPVKPARNKTTTAMHRLARQSAPGLERSLEPQPLHASAAISGSEVTIFQKTLSEHISQYRGYPERARVAGIAGVVEVGFTMDRNGAVLKVWIEHDSGFAVLDGEALATVLRAQPLPRIPADLPDHLDILLPISFSLTT
jgi:protein TonB